MKFREKQIDKRESFNPAEHEEMRKGTVLKERYEIEKTIGKGRVSVVYLAYDRILQQEVAVKELIFIEHENKFIREAKILFGKYEWKGFPEIKEIIRENDKRYLVMEYISGKSLREYVNDSSQHRIREKDALEMLLPIMSSLEFLHAEGEIHSGISLEKIYLRTNGTCCLLGAGTWWLECEAKEDSCRIKAPEIKNRKDFTGPWSDVWEICAVLYEMTGGKRIRNAHGDLMGNLKKLSDFVEIDEQIAKAIHQGLNVSIQQRFFCISGFLEQFKRKIPEHLRDTYNNIFQASCQGKIQAVWGEKWLQITASDSEKFNSENNNIKFKWGRKQRRNAVMTGLAAGLVFCSVLIGAVWHSNQPPKKEQLLNLLETSGEKQEYDDAVIYTVSKKFVEENNLKSDMLYKFAVKEEQLKEIVEDSLQIELQDSSSVYWNGNIYVYHDFLKRMEINCYETRQYQVEYQKKDAEIEWNYDITDEYVTQVSFTGEKEITQKLIADLLPALVPETYFTEEEIEKYYEIADENSGYYRMAAHGKFVVIFNHQKYVDGEPWNIVFANYLNPKRDSNEKEEECKIRAGNYARDSEDYREYLNFLENHAESKTETEDKITYTLNEADVAEWGLPCNEFLLDMKDEELLRRLEEQGIVLYEETEKVELTADVYPGGSVQTSFLTRRKYTDSENTKLLIISDYISGNLFSVYVYDEENRIEKVADMAADVLEILSKDIEPEKVKNNFMEQLQEMETAAAENQSSVMMASLADCGYSIFRINDYKHLCVFFEHHSFSFEENGYAPYSWS